MSQLSAKNGFGGTGELRDTLKTNISSTSSIVVEFALSLGDSLCEPPLSQSQDAEVKNSATICHQW